MKLMLTVSLVKMYKILISALFLFGTNAIALSRAELCSFRARFVESFAESRDSGKTEKQTLAETRKSLRDRYGPNAPDMKTWVNMVYRFREFPPSQMRQVTEMSCLKEQD